MPDYFIKTGGSDAADGLSDANAWATWARVITKFGAGIAAGDRFLFRGGDSFSASAVLIPNNTGTSAAPITIGSYNGGKATINASAIVGGLIYNGFTFIIVRDLILNGPGKALTASANSGIHFDTTANDCQIINCEIKNFNNIGINTNGDRCLVAACFVHDIGAHGIVAGDPGDQLELCFNQITAWGGNSTFEGGGRHGIYLESKNGYIHDNEFYSPDIAVSGQAISCRKASLRVINNTIHDIAGAIGWFNYDPTAVSNLTPGYMWFYGNHLYNISQYGFYIDGSPPAARVGGPGTFQNTVDIAIVNNLMRFNGGGASDYAIAEDSVTPNIDASLRIVNNIITGTPGKYLKLAPPTRAGKSLVEKKNLFFGATQANPYSYSGTAYANLAAYQAGSSQGTGDLATDPLLQPIPSPYPLSLASPGAEVGATDGESGGLAYVTSGSAGATKTGWGYRGASPDLGAVEAYFETVARPNFRVKPPHRIG